MMPDQDLEFDVSTVRVEWGDLRFSGPGRLRLTSDDARVEAGGESLVASYRELRGGGWRPREITLHGEPGTVVLESHRGLEQAWASLVELACPLPELTRAHRLLGSTRGGHVDLQPKLLAPLLQARKRLETEADLDARVSTFDARALRERLNSALQALGRESYPASHPDRRALEAELEEAMDSLFVGLDAVESSAGLFRSAPEAIRFMAWRDWVATVSTVFALADTGWASAARLLPGTVKP